MKSGFLLESFRHLSGLWGKIYSLPIGALPFICSIPMSKITIPLLPASSAS